MKAKLILTVLIATALGFTSCKKCMTCKYTYKNYNGGIWDNANEIEEFCGSANHLEEAEATFKANAASSEREITKEPVCWEE